jgi:hypothetical protein
LGFESANEGDIKKDIKTKEDIKTKDEASHKRKRCPFEEEADEERFERQGRLKWINVAEQLRRIIGKDAKFRSV